MILKVINVMDVLMDINFFLIVMVSCLEISGFLLSFNPKIVSNCKYYFLKNVIATRMDLHLLFVTKLLANVHAMNLSLVKLVISAKMDILIFQIPANVSIT